MVRKVLCVAEKPSMARSITGILSGGQYETVSIFLIILYQNQLLMYDILAA